MSDQLQALARLLQVPHLGPGDEAAIIAAAASLAHDLGFEVGTSADGLLVSVEAEAEGPTLVLASHLDTVPAGEGWTRPPHGGEIQDDILFGRGAVDARGACCAMLLALAAVKERGLPRGRVVVALSVGEEGDDPSLPRLLDRIGPIDAGVVGEPTAMRIALSQKGLMVIELVAKGQQGHAARITEPGAIELLAKDLIQLQYLSFPRHATLGRAKVTPTRFQAGIADNVTPPEARAILDVRSTPACDGPTIHATLCRSLKCDVRVLLDTWTPCETPADAPVVEAARRALPKAPLFGSDAASDWVFLMQRGIPAIKIGPGDNRWAHRPDERITRAELQAGIDGYISIIQEYCAEAEAGEIPQCAVG